MTIIAPRNSEGGSFQQTAPRKTTENTVKHHNGCVGSMLANHCDGYESLVVVTTLVLPASNQLQNYDNCPHHTATCMTFTS